MSLSVMLVGSGGVGKSYLASTSPGPILILDLEGAAYKMPRPVVNWAIADIEAGKYPTGLTEQSIVSVNTEEWKNVAAVFNSLRSPKSPFKSFWIDSATVLTQLGESEVARKKTNVQQGFGELLNFLRPELISLKNLTARPDMTLEVFGVTAWQRDDKAAPSLQGGIGGLFNHTFDCVGYVSLEVINGQLANNMRVFPAPNGLDPKAKGTKSMYLSAKDGSLLNPNFAQLSNQETSNGKS